MILSELVFDYLMILVEDRTQVKMSAACLSDIMDKFLELKGEKKEENQPIYSRLKDEKKTMGNRKSH